MNIPTLNLPARRGGFTLIELMFAIGIAVLLAAIILPTISIARKKAERTATALTLQAIASGLEAYKSDFSDYPRVFVSGATAAYPYPDRDTGAAVLGKALAGIYDATTSTVSPNAYDPTKPYTPGMIAYSSSTWYVCVIACTGSAPANNGANPKVSTNNNWAVFIPDDGADGLGTRLRAGGAGKVYGPYLRLDSVKMSGLDFTDRNGNPILYFPASSAKPNKTLANGFVAQENTASNPAVLPLFDANDNLTPFRSTSEAPLNYDVNALRRIQVMLGDLDYNGAINGAETAGSTGPYVLWAAGPDGVFGPSRTDGGTGGTPGTFTATAATKCDDVTNFR